MGPLVGGFPLGPCIVSLRALFLIIIGARKALTCEHGRARKKEQGLVGYCSSFPAGLPLGVLEHVNVLGDSLDLEVLALNFVMQLQEAEDVPDGSP